GGDFYDIIRQNNKLIMYVSDVTGHGLDAAMMSSFIKSTINSYVAAVPLTEISLSQIVRFLAQQFLKEDYPEDYFICLALVVLDIDTGQVDYTELGLQDPLLYYNGGKSCQSLINRSLPISPVLNINEIEFEEKSITLNRGDILIFNTDGITEQRQGGKYYLKRFKEVCGQVAELPPTVISQKIIDDFYDFNANSYQADDDITYLILQAKPEDRKEFSFELESNTNEINRLRRKLEDILPSTTDGDMALMGIHELVVNAIEHGNNFNKTKRVCIELILTGDYIYTSIEDEGDGFDWKQLVKSEFDLENDSERGRGIMMASRGCDYIFYNNRGNKAFLLKYR
ncbi:MAG: ATP-binding SpoIIE family protein phosphatase, partial [Candidatus Woesearchaeota archaeon]